MAGYKWEKFGGIRPLATNLRLGPDEALVARTVDFHRDVLRPRALQSAWNNDLHPYLTLASPLETPASIFHFTDRVTSEKFWLYWLDDVDVAPGPVENAEQRHYYTGDGAPKMFTADSIDDDTPPYPEDADIKFPKTWYFLGVPAPAAAPTIDGESYVPPDTAKSGVLTGLSAAYVTIRFNPQQSTQKNTSRAMFNNGQTAVYDSSIFADSDSGGQELVVMEVGTRLKVTEVVDADHVKVVGIYGNGHFEPFADNYDDPVPANYMDDRWDWFYASPADHGPNFDTTKLYKRRNGKKNDDCWTYHVPDETIVTVTAHAIKVGDIVRVTAATSPMKWTTPLRILAGPPIGGGAWAKGRQRHVTDPDEDTIEFTGELSYFIERDGREFDPTISDVVVDAREPTTRSYVYTYVTSFGEEGPPSEPTEPFTLALGDSVTVEGFTTPPTEHRDITTYRLYRTNTGGADTAFQFVADVPIASTEYADALADDELGEVLQSETWEPPPEDMIGIVAMPNGFLAGFLDNVLCFSEPGFPHAWPVDYRMPLDQKIVGVKVINGSLIVATRGHPYVVAGTHPRQMAARKETEPAPCIDKRSMVECGDAVIYVSTDGLILASPGGFSNVTLPFYTREQWVDTVVGPPIVSSRSARAWYKDGEYILFSAYLFGDTQSSSLVFDFRDDSKLNISDAGIGEPRAAFTDPVDGELYYVPYLGDSLDVLSAPVVPPYEYVTQITAGEYINAPFATVVGYDRRYTSPVDIGAIAPDPTVLAVGHEISAFRHFTEAFVGYQLYVEVGVGVTPATLTLFDRIEFVGDNLLTTTLTSDVGSPTFDSGNRLIYAAWPAATPQISEGNTYDLHFFITAGYAPILRWRYLYPTVAPEDYSPGTYGQAYYRSGIVMLPRPMALSVAQIICRRTSTFAKLRVEISGFRYDSAATSVNTQEEGHVVQLCDVTVIDGDVDAGGYPGEQRSKPFRLAKNVLVDALRIDVWLNDSAELEAILVGETYDDLVRM